MSPLLVKTKQSRPLVQTVPELMLVQNTAVPLKFSGGKDDTLPLHWTESFTIQFPLNIEIALFFLFPVIFTRA